MKLQYSKTVLPLLLILSTTFAQATPTAANVDWVDLLPWFDFDNAQLEQQALCPGYPKCKEPPMAPEQLPENNPEQK